MAVENNKKITTDCLALRDVLKLVLGLFILCFTSFSFAWKMEAGSITMPSTFDEGEDYGAFNFQQTYDQPPLVFIVATSAGGDVATIRLRNITTTGFEASIVEAMSEDGPHVNMDVDYFAIERGASGTQWEYDLPDGTRFVVGEISTDQQSFNNTGPGGGQDQEDTETITIDSGAFASSQPTVLAQIQTMNNVPNHEPENSLTPWMTTVVTDVQDDQFDVSIERSEDYDQASGANFRVDDVDDEVIGYVVMESSSQGQVPLASGAVTNFETINTVDNLFEGFSQNCNAQSFAGTYGSSPLVMVTKITRNSEDGGWFRRCSLSTSAVGLQIDEETRQEANARTSSGDAASLLVFSGSFTYDSEYVPPETSTNLMLEAGSETFSATDDWTTIEFQQSYETVPVVFVLTDTNNPDPQAFRVRNVTEDSFEAIALEPPRASGAGSSDTDMEMHYVVFPVGQFEFPDGTKLEANRITMNNYQSKVFGGDSYLDIGFSSGFASTPSVLAQVQTINNGVTDTDPWLTAFAINVSSSGAQISMDRAEVDTGTTSIFSEEVAYLAIEQGVISDFVDLNGNIIKSEAFTTSDSITDDCPAVAFNNTYTSAPLVVANKQRYDGGDGGWIRRCAVSTSQVEIQIDEDVASDNDRNHTTESVAMVVFSDAFVADFSNVAYYQLDETIWNDNPGDAADSSNYGLDGEPDGNADTSPAQVCYGADLNGSNQIVEVPDNTLLDIEEELTVTAWINPRSYNAGGLKTIVSKDENYEFHLNSSGQVNWWWGGGTRELTGSTAAPLNSWTHVAIVYSSSEPFQAIYVNGVLDASRTDNSASLDLNSDPLQIGGDQGFGGRYWDGLIDEVRVYSRAISQAGIQDIMSYTHPCENALDHIEISAVADANTCAPHAVTLSACADPDCNNLLNDYSEQVNLQVIDNSGAVISRGSWLIGSASGSMTDATADDGEAAYQFVTADDGQAIVELDYIYADGIKLRIEDTVNNVSAESEVINFSDNAFLMQWTDSIDDDPADFDPTTAIAGRPHQLEVSYVRRDRDETDPNGQCGLVESYDGNIDLKAWYSDSGQFSNTPVAPRLSYGSTTSAALPDNKAGAIDLSSVPFTDGVATLNLETSDVGYFSLGVADPTGFISDVNGAALEVSGSSPEARVVPFGMTIDVHDSGASVECSTQGEKATNSTGDYYAVDANGSIYKRAGENFQVAVRSVLWQAGDDDLAGENNDGIPDSDANLFDNGCVPSFGSESTSESMSVSIASFLPATGTQGRLEGSVSGALAFDSYNNGVALRVTDYDEVGIIDLNGSLLSSDYLGTGKDYSVSFLNFGRFIPNHFTVANNSPVEFKDGTDIWSCPFTYQGQSFEFASDIELTVTAYEAGGGVTENYGGEGTAEDYFKLASIDATDSSLFTFTDNASANPSLAIDLSSASSQITDNENFNGVFTIIFSDSQLVYERAADKANGAGDAAFDADVDWTLIASALTDSDSVCLSDIATPGTCLDHSILDITGTEIRYGRVSLGNNNGSELLPLELSARIEYWNETVIGNGLYGFVTNTDDVCSSIWPNSSLADGSYTGNLSSGETTPSIGAFTAGEGVINLTAPGEGNEGSVTITLDVEEWLQYDFLNRGSEDPSGTGTFGIFSGKQPIFYLRESYR